MNRFRWFLGIVLGLGLAGLLIVMVWYPTTDADALALAKERLARRVSWRQNQPMPGAAAVTDPLDARLQRAGFKLGAPLFVRIYKRSYELEVWLKRDSGYEKFATYPICYFSGNLGPKLKTGDWQSPEGVYQVGLKQLNPNSRWHRAFNLGFPNTYDQSYGRTGSYLMVHGGCSSVGCYAITNAGIDDVYRLASAALAGGQASFQVQALPFRMTADALAARAQNRNAPFWGELKSVADAFDATHLPPDVVVCGGHYKVLSGVKAGAAAENGCRRL